MEAIVLAGGVGTRLRSVVSHVPKPMADVGGRPFLEWLLSYWISQGISKFILGVGYKYEIIQKYFGPAFQGVPIEYAVESEPLGTGGGLILAAGLLSKKTPCLVLNGDTYFQVSLEQFNKMHQKHSAEVSIALFQVSEGGRYGSVQCDASNRIKSFREKGSRVGKCLINGGVYILNPAALNSKLFQKTKKISFETEMLPELSRQNKTVCGFQFLGKFIDIGIPEDYEKAYNILHS